MLTTGRLSSLFWLIDLCVIPTLFRYKKYVLCPICNDRHKAMIITRCLHMFCDHCINTMVASRSRKCPACGEKFSQSELRQLYWT